MSTAPTSLHATADATLLALAVVDTLMTTRLLSSPVRVGDAAGDDDRGAFDDRLTAAFVAPRVVRTSGRAVPRSLHEFVR